MSALFDRFSRRFHDRQERKQREEREKTDAEVVDPDAPPIPDAPVEQAQSERVAGRNDPCPCGSGKKFKKCCGKAP